MAGDWIPISIDLSRKREVTIIAERCEMSDEEVVGWLVKFWSWVTVESRDGHISGVTKSAIMRTTGAKEVFVNSLSEVGWLRISGAGITIPNWDNWLSKSAKTRVCAARRKRREREKTRHAPVALLSRSSCDKNGTTGEERRVEKRSIQRQQQVLGKLTTPLPPFPPDDAAAAALINASHADDLAERLKRKIGYSGKDYAVVHQIATLQVHGIIPEASVAHAAQQTAEHKPKRPVAYFRNALRSVLDAQGRDLVSLLNQCDTPKKLSGKPVTEPAIAAEVAALAAATTPPEGAT